MGKDVWLDFIKVFVLQAVKKALPFVWSRLREAMRTNTAKAGCVVIGSAMVAYGTGKYGGAECISGAIIGISMIVVKAIPVGKILKYIPISKLIGFVFKSKLDK